MAEIHLPANRLLLICKCRFWRFLKVDRVKSTFIDLLKKIDQIDQIDRIDQIDFYAVPFYQSLNAEPMVLLQRRKV